MQLNSFLNPLEVIPLTNNIGNIDSKFRYILVAAKRTRQLQGGSPPLINGTSRKFTRIAQQEVASGLVKYEIIGQESDSEETDTSSDTITH